MKSTNYMLKYLGEGDLSAFDKIAPAFEKEVNEAIKGGLKQVLNAEPILRDKEIKEILRQEKKEYEIKKKEFYENPLHWSNNKRRMRGLPVLRGMNNKYRSKKFHSFKPTPRVFFLMEDIVEEMICNSWKDNNFFDKFVDFKDIDIGDKNEYVINFRKTFTR